jgi:hypothetical protein
LDSRVEPIRFSSQIRYRDPVKSSGLSVADIPAEHVPAFGGLKQQRVRGTLRGAEFASSVMPAGGRRLALGVSKAMMAAGGLSIGDRAEFEVTAVGRD